MGICNRHASQQGIALQATAAIVLKSLAVRASCCPIEQLPDRECLKNKRLRRFTKQVRPLRHGLDYCRIGLFLRAGDLSAPVPIMILADPRLADGGIAPLRCHTFTNSSTDESAFPHVSNDYF